MTSKSVLGSHEQDSQELWVALEAEYPDYIKALENDDHAFAEIDPLFLGFVRTYKLLAQLIPEKRTVYDFGCAYAPQAWYFRNHARYVGVDEEIRTRVLLPNAEYIEMRAEDYLTKNKVALDTNAFAIVNYVPSPAAVRAVKLAFSDVYTFYPRHGDRDDSLPEFRSFR